MNGRSLLLVGALWAAFGTAVAGLAAGSTATAASGADGSVAVLSITHAAQRSDAVVTITGAGGDGEERGAAEVRLDGRTVDSVSVWAGTALPPADVVLVVDSGPRVSNATLETAKSALARLTPGGRVGRTAVVTAGGVAAVVTPLTADASQVRAGLAGIAPAPAGVSMWDALDLAARQLDARPAGSGPGIVVALSASPDSSSVASVAEVRSRLTGRVGNGITAMWGLVTNAGVPMGVLADGAPVWPMPLAGDEAIAPAVGAVAERINGLAVVSFPRGPAVGHEVPMVLTMSGLSTTVSYAASADRLGPVALRPPLSEEGSGGLGQASGVWGALGAFAATPWGLALMVLAGASAVMGVVWVGVVVLVPDRAALRYHLAAYEDALGRAEAGDQVDAESESLIGQSGFLRRAVELTGRVASRQGVLARVEALLERAEWPFRANEALFLWVAAPLLAGGLVGLLAGSVPLGVLTALLVSVAPPAVAAVRVSRRSKAFAAQLPDMLQLMAGTLRAGYSIAQGLDAVADEIDDPMGRELRRASNEARLGRPLEDALESVAERMGSEDFAWAVMAIRIQREVGGNLAELLMTVSETMTGRERLRRDVAGLTAEGRMSAIVLGCLPPGLGLVMWVMNPGYISLLFEPGLGYALLGGAAVLMLLGFVWMRATITVEV